ncbi:MAG: hypothetical protein M3O68_07400 [Thermoproteota archaeon]|nr:hypothetical protein [Thermoproteota archaeon]
MTGLQYNNKNIKSYQKWREFQQQQFYPIQVKRLTIKETKEYHLKILWTFH